MLARGRPGPANPVNFVGYDRVIFLMVMGLAFVWFGWYVGGHGFGWFFAVLGVAFFIFGISQFVMARKFREQFRDKKD